MMMHFNVILQSLPKFVNGHFPSLCIEGFMNISPLGATFYSTLAIIYLVKIKNHDVPHYKISSTLLTPSLSSVQILSSAPYVNTHTYVSP
jgi:hypothetical protein